MSANGFFGGEFSSPTSGTGDRYASPKALRYRRGRPRERGVHRRASRGRHGVIGAHEVSALEGAMGNLSVKLNPFRRSNDEVASPRGRADSDGARSPPPPA